MAYTTQAKVEAYMGSDLSSISLAVTAWIASVTAWINKYTGTTWETGVASTRYYDGNGTDRIFVDPFNGAPSEISIIDSEGNVSQDLLTDSDYILYPLNSTAKSEIVISGPADWWPGVWPSGNRRLKITANFWSSDTVPADIELVATMLVAQIAGGAVAAGILGAVGAKKSESLGDYSVTYAVSSDSIGALVGNALGVFSILDQYRDPVI